MSSFRRGIRRVGSTFTETKEVVKGDHNSIELSDNVSQHLSVSHCRPYVSLHVLGLETVGTVLSSRGYPPRTLYTRQLVSPTFGSPITLFVVNTVCFKHSNLNKKFLRTEGVIC